MNVNLFVLSAVAFDPVLTGNSMYTYYSEIPKLMNTLGTAAFTLNKDFTQGLTLNQCLPSITARSISLICLMEAIPLCDMIQIYTSILRQYTTIYVTNATLFCSWRHVSAA